MITRIVSCIDVEAESPKEAYKKLNKVMGDVEMKTEGGISWESTDEWYGADGDILGEQEVTEVRLEALQEINSGD